MYGKAERIRHRWWFPEYIYREVTLSRFLGATIDRSAWRRAMDYWLNREGIRDRLGSEDSYLYFKADVPLDYRAGAVGVVREPPLPCEPTPWTA